MARMSSGRFPGKMMEKIDGKPLLWYSVNSLKNFTESQSIYVATSDQPSDDPIEEYSNKLGIHCYRGDLNNPAKRFRNLLANLNCDYAIRICGDNVFVSHKILNGLFKIIETNKFDFISNTKERTFPFGMSVEAVKRDKYIKYYKNFDIEQGDFEHVMSYFYREKNIEKYFMKNNIYPKASGINLAIDHENDLTIVEGILKNLKEPYYECSLEKLFMLYHG